MTDERATKKYGEETLAQVKRLVTVSEKLAANVVEFDKLLKSTQAELVSLKQKASCTGSEKEESNQVTAEACKKFKRRLLSLYFMLIGPV